MLGYSIYKLLSATIYQLLFTQTAGTQRVFPRLYLKAALETIILALIVTWTFTLSWDPNQVWQQGSAAAACHGLGLRSTVKSALVDKEG